MGVKHICFNFCFLLIWTSSWHFRASKQFVYLIKGQSDQAVWFLSMHFSKMNVWFSTHLQYSTWAFHTSNQAQAMYALDFLNSPFSILLPEWHSRDDKQSISYSVYSKCNKTGLHLGSSVVKSVIHSIVAKISHSGNCPSRLTSKALLYEHDVILILQISTLESLALSGLGCLLADVVCITYLGNIISAYHWHWWC